MLVYCYGYLARTVHTSFWRPTLDLNQMKIIRLELFKTLRLISKSKLRLRFFAGFSSTLRVFARPAGDSRRCARKRAKPAKEFRNLLSLRRIFLASVIASFLILSSANAQQAKGELRGQVVDE